MLTIKYNNQSFDIRNELTELTIKDFEFITNNVNDKEKPTFDKWSEIFVYLGVPQEIVDEMDSDEFLQIAKEFYDIETNFTDVPQFIEVDGITYRAYEEKFKMTVKEMSMIEAAVRKNRDRYIAEVMAIIYKNPELDKALTYDKSHIHFKAELFRKTLTADKCVPMINFISGRLIKDSEQIQENE